MAADFDFVTLFKLISSKRSHGTFQFKSLRFSGRMESFKRRKSTPAKDQAIIKLRTVLGMEEVLEMFRRSSCVSLSGCMVGQSDGKIRLNGEKFAINSLVLSNCSFKCEPAGGLLSIKSILVDRTDFKMTKWCALSSIVSLQVGIVDRDFWTLFGKVAKKMVNLRRLSASVEWDNKLGACKSILRLLDSGIHLDFLELAV